MACIIDSVKKCVSEEKRNMENFSHIMNLLPVTVAIIKIIIDFIIYPGY